MVSKFLFCQGRTQNKKGFLIQGNIKKKKKKSIGLSTPNIWDQGTSQDNINHLGRKHL